MSKDSLSKFKFVKEPTGKWYIELPGWTGEHADLEIVCGADLMLDYVGGGKSEVELL